MPWEREAHDLIDTINSLIIACAQQQKMLIKKPRCASIYRERARGDIICYSTK